MNSCNSQHLKANINQSVRTRGGRRPQQQHLCVCGSKVSLLPSILWNSPYSYLSWLGILLSLCNSLHPILLLHFQCFGGAGRAAEGRGNGCYSQTTQGTAIPQQNQDNTLSQGLRTGVLNLCRWAWKALNICNDKNEKQIYSEKSSLKFGLYPFSIWKAWKVKGTWSVIVDHLFLWGPRCKKPAFNVIDQLPKLTFLAK